MDLKAQIAGEQFTHLINLEQLIRQSGTLEALQYTIVNETRRLVPYRQAALLLQRGKHHRTAALSDIPAVDRTAPFVQWLERTARAVEKSGRTGETHRIDPADFDQSDRASWREYCPDTLIWIPLTGPQQGHLGSLMVATEAFPTEHQKVLLEHLAATSAHALQVFLKKGGWRLNTVPDAKKRLVLAGLSALLIGLSFAYRVHLTALAPVEIVPRQPFVVTSPLDGVVQKIAVKSNQSVASGDLLVVLDDTELRNRHALAEKALEVAKAEYSRARRGAFVDARSQAVLAELEAQVAQRRGEVAYARERLDRTVLLADRAGVAITPPPEAWEGRPVRLGEAIMRIADPQQVRALILLPVKDAVLLDAGSRVHLFLDSDPLDPVWARVERSEYMPEPTPEGHFAYRTFARIEDIQRAPRIGLRGTAKIYGPRVSLFFYLFRRPMNYFRQVTGF
jgi:hypothetical protein